MGATPASSSPAWGNYCPVPPGRGPMVDSNSFYGVSRILYGVYGYRVRRQQGIEKTSEHKARRYDARQPRRTYGAIIQWQ